MPVSGGEVEAKLRLVYISDLKAQLKGEEAALQQMIDMSQQAATKVNAMGMSFNNALQPEIDKSTAKVAQLREQIEKISPPPKAATDGFAILDSYMVRMLERMAVIYALKASFDFVTGIFEAGREALTLSENLSVTVERAQELTYISQQLEVPINTVATALATMTKNIGTGDNEANGALRQLGINMNDLKGKDPTETFMRISTALNQVEDDFKRTGLEADIFGRSKVDSLVKNFESLKDEAHEMNIILSDEQVKALAAVAQGWDNVIAKAKAYIAMGLTGKGNELPGVPKGGFDPSRPDTYPGFSAYDDLDVNLQLQGMSPKKPPKAPSAGGLQAPEITDTKQIIATQQELNATIELRMLLERQAAEAEHTLFEAKLSNAKQELQWLAETMKLEEAKLKIRNQQTIDELNAKEKLANRQGFDLNGNRLLDPNSPEGLRQKYDRDMEALERNPGNPGGSFEGGGGPSVSAQRELLTQEFYGAFQKAATAANEVARAHDQAGRAGDTAAQGLNRAGGSAVDLANAFNTARGGFQGNVAPDPGFAGYQGAKAGTPGPATDLFKTVYPGFSSQSPVPLSSIYIPPRADGGPVTAGRPYKINERGEEIFVPSENGHVLPNGQSPGGGGPTVIVQMSGMLVSNDPSAKAMLEKAINDSVMSVLRQGRKLPAA